MQREAINKDNYDVMCYSNRDLIKGEIRGVVTEFHGYCETGMRKSPVKTDEILAKAGIVTMYPFYGPWAWANDTAVKTIDRLLELTYEMNSLDPKKIPLVITGSSMGGMTSLVYTYYSSFEPVACAADCPVTDLCEMIRMRDDIYRAMITAFGHYPCSLEDAMKSASPVELASKMPKIPYYIIGGTNDIEVDYTVHCSKYVPLMRSLGYDVTFRLIEGMEHCKMPDEELCAYCDFIIRNIEENRK